MDESGQESAEEVLARLERYVESRRGRPQVLTPVDRRASASAAETDIAARPVPLDTLIPSREETPRRRRHFASEVAPALTAVAICSFIILVSEWFDSVITVGVGAALMLVGVVALVRRVPLARAYTFGLVVAALLIRFS
ncbi:MAG: hypothetical protein QOG50_677 [Actinomycetota bacterium]|nr:hypothetical protein [Actinomycetota bacterium]